MTREDEIKEMVHLNALLKIADISATVFHWHFPRTGIMVFRHGDENESFTDFDVLKARVHSFLTESMVSA